MRQCLACITLLFVSTSTPTLPTLHAIDTNETASVYSTANGCAVCTCRVCHVDKQVLQSDVAVSACMTHLHTCQQAEILRHWLQRLLCGLHRHKHLWWLSSNQVHGEAHSGLRRGCVVHLHHSHSCSGSHQVSVCCSGVPLFDGGRGGGYLPLHPASAGQMVPCLPPHLCQHANLCRWAPLCHP